MRMDSTDLTIRESEDEDVYASVEKNIEITKHGNCEQIPVSSFCFLLYCPVFVLLLYNDNLKERASPYDN